MSVAVGSVRSHVVRPPPAPRLGGRHRRTRPARPVQPTLDDLGTPLSDVTFVVVDLETTGGTPADCAITEIGAVKVRGGEVLGEFQTLVDPGGPVPAFIQVLTGITTTMLIGAPRIEEVLPSFLEFSRGAVLVAHNAPVRHRLPQGRRRARPGTPGPATRWWTPSGSPGASSPRDEAPNHKLSTLAGLFHATVTPEPPGARRTRARRSTCCTRSWRGSRPLGVTHLEDLATATDPVPAGRAPQAHPGRRPARRPGRLPVPRARATRCCTSAPRPRRCASACAPTSRPPRSARRMIEMVRVAHARRPRGVRDAARGARPRAAAHRRALPALQPPLALPRAHAVGPPHVRAVPAPVGGPRGQRRGRRHLHRPVRLDRARPSSRSRRCTRRSRCGSAPAGCRCVARGRRVGVRARRDGQVRRPVHRRTRAPEDYAEVVDRRPARDARATPRPSSQRARRPDRLAGRRRNGSRRPRPSATGSAAFLRGAARAQRFAPLARLPGARGGPAGRRRRLGARARAATVGSPGPRASTGAPTRGRRSTRCSATGEHVEPPVAPATAAHPEETDLILAWLEQPGVRLVAVDVPWACPVRSAEARATRRRRRRARPRPRRRRRRRPSAGADRAGTDGAVRELDVTEADRSRWSRRRAGHPDQHPPAAHGMMTSMLTAIVLIDIGRRAHPRGRRRDRRDPRRQRGLLRHRRGRPHRHGARARARRPRRRHRRPGQQDRGRPAHPDLHRVPHVLPARPRAGVRPRARGLSAERSGG